MNRMLGKILVAGLLLGLNSSTSAQTFPTDYYGHDGYGYGPGSNLADLPFGGFGFEYTQGYPVSGVVMDQYERIYAAPVVVRRPVVAARQAAARTTIRSRGRTVTVQPRYALTTGSLGWVGANGMVVDPTAMRYRSYGSGYELSPYGTTQYYGPWKGQTLGY
jgi:hypothetical protein